jgi:SNF2 family DNA or RNA helicase
MIYVGTNIDKFDIADPYALILSDLEKESEEKDEPAEPEEYNKASAIADFCCGKKTKSKLEKIKIRVPGIMGGFAKLPVAEHRKVLIYALKSSVCSEITKKLENRDVKYWKLRGTVKQLSTIARKFNKYDGDCALIIQSEKHYAGLNLQTATHAILYGVPHNESILSQFIGRGQRMGRTYQFNIIFMVYENEFKSLIENYTASLVDD